MAVACTKDRGYTTLTGMDPARIMKSYPMPSSKCCNVVTISSTIPLAGLRHGHPLFWGAPDHGTPKKGDGGEPAAVRCGRLYGFAVLCRAGRLGVALGDERVRLVGDLGESEQVLEAEALPGLPLTLVSVDARKGDVMLGDAPDLRFPKWSP